jgi:hypothetical protein
VRFASDDCRRADEVQGRARDTIEVHGDEHDIVVECGQDRIRAGS